MRAESPGCVVALFGTIFAPLVFAICVGLWPGGGGFLIALFIVFAVIIGCTALDHRRRNQKSTPMPDLRTLKLPDPRSGPHHSMQKETEKARDRSASTLSQRLESANEPQHEPRDAHQGASFRVEDLFAQGRLHGNKPFKSTGQAAAWCAAVILLFIFLYLVSHYSTFFNIVSVLVVIVVIVVILGILAIMLAILGTQLRRKK
jgi:hypothetical protein